MSNLAPAVGFCVKVIEVLADSEAPIGISEISRRTDINKFAIIFTVTVLMITVCEAYQYWICIKEIGLPWANAPTISLPLLSEFSGTIGGHFFLIYLRQLGVALAFAALTAAVSRVTKKFLPTLAIMGVLAFAPIIFGYFGFDFLEELSLMNFLEEAEGRRE